MNGTRSKKSLAIVAALLVVVLSISVTAYAATNLTVNKVGD